MKPVKFILPLFCLLLILGTGCFGSKKKPTNNQTYTPVEIPVKTREDKPIIPDAKPTEPTATKPIEPSNIITQR